MPKPSNHPNPKSPKTTPKTPNPTPNLKVPPKSSNPSSKNPDPAPSIFTKIIRGEIPCYKIYEDDKTFAFLDINPETRGHTLLVPKIQVDKIYDLPDEDYDALLHAAKKLSKHLEERTGRRTLWKVIGTDVPHAHIHLHPLDEHYRHGRHLKLTPAEFEKIRQDLAYPSEQN